MGRTVVLSDTPDSGMYSRYPGSLGWEGQWHTAIRLTVHVNSMQIGILGTEVKFPIALDS